GAEVAKLVEKGKGQFAGPEILGKKLGVIGLGAIGVLVANAAKSLGMEVYGYDPYLSVNAAWALSRSIHHAATLEQIYAECDYITLHLPLNDGTRGMIGTDALAQMKDGVRVLNFARGELVDSDAMKAALANGKVAAYVVDFPSDEMLCVDNVTAIPHLGASTPESEDNCAVMAVQELKAYLEQGVIRNSVNFPAMELEKSSAVRVCVLHRNVPTLLAQISTVISEAGVNIETLTNRSRKDIAYTVADISDDITQAVMDKVAAIDGVIRVRKV
ncbi:MAG: 3-phosphoglycerate dehydrogenase, partial [Clostridia bacterium]|nr:3-phosphoglycerate dehydrogenase [Clostridia bacterium]